MIFKLCPMVFDYAQHIFPGERKILRGGFSLLVTGLTMGSRVPRGG